MPTRPEDFLTRVRGAIEAFAMADPAERMLVAVSGGADSLCLLHALVALGFRVEVAHLDHQARGAASAEDAEAVEAVAARIGVPFHLIRRPVAREAECSALSFETYARNLRYAEFVRLAKAHGCAVLATGHHADDQAETVLLRILRGTSPEGLAGIPPVRMYRGVRIVRPLLRCTREEILAFLDAHGLAWRTDATNADPRYVRNRVRHELMPFLAERFNPRIRESLCRLAELVRGEDEILDAAAQALLASSVAPDGAIGRKPFAQAPRAVQRRALVLWASPRGVACTFERVERAVDFIAMGAAGRLCDLGGGHRLRNGREATALLHGVGAREERCVALRVPGVTEAFGKRFHVREAPAGLDRARLAEYCSPARQVFDADALGAPMAVRLRRAGDRFTPLGMTGQRKLKDFFIDAGVPTWQRDRTPLIIAQGAPGGAGERIAWVVGHAMGAHAAVTPLTRHVLEIEVTDATE